MQSQPHLYRMKVGSAVLPYTRAEEDSKSRSGEKH